MVTQIAGVLDALADSRLRATRCLQFLLRASGANQGFLFMVQHGELMPPVRIADEDLPESVAALEYDVIRAEISDDDTTSDSDDDPSSLSSMWTHTLGLVYRPVVLRRDAADGGAMVGLALLLTQVDRPFHYPLLVAGEFGRQLQRARAASERPQQLTENL